MVISKINGEILNQVHIYIYIFISEIAYRLESSPDRRYALAADNCVSKLAILFMKCKDKLVAIVTATPIDMKLIFLFF